MRPPTPPAARSRRAVTAAVLAAGLLLAGCGGSGDDAAPEATDGTDATASDGASAGDAASDPSAPVAQGPPVDLDGVEVAATYDGTEVTGEELAALVDAQADTVLAAVPEEQQEDARGDLTRQVLGQEIQVGIVRDLAADEYGVDPSEDEVDAALQEAIESAGGQEAFQSFLAAQGLTEEQAREQVELQEVVQRLQFALAEEAGFDQSAVRDEFDTRASAGQYEESEVRHILLESEEDAQAALARLEDGEDFSELATELSTGPSGPQGGVLGSQPRGSYVDPFEEAVWSDDTVVGEVVGPVETEFGWHLIVVDGRSEQTFADVEEELTAELAGAAFEAAITDALAAADVQVDDAIGTWDAAARAVVPPQ